MFVFAVVNALSNDNVDEKFFGAFMANTVPVVIAGTTARFMAPGGSASFIDASRFESPAALAAHLRWLQQNPAEYLQYFEWRRDAPLEAPEPLRKVLQTSVYRPGTLCRLCGCSCDSACMQKRDVSRCGYRERRRLEAP